jgi:integrase
MRLTDISIRTLPVPAKGQKTYFDESLTSFGCRVSQGGTRSFVVQHGADRQLITIGRYPIISLSEARAQAKHILAERTLGKHRPRSIPFDDAVSLFLAACEQRNKPRTVKDYTRILKQHFPFARMQLSAIMPQDINRRLDRLHGTPAEQAYALIVIKIFFNWAVTRHYLDANPCARFKRPSRADARERVLTDAELVAVYQTALAGGDTFSRIVALLVLTGQRRGEIGALRWDWIDEKEHTITLPSAITKNKRTHMFPYGPVTAAILERIPRESEYVFPASRTNVRGTPTTSFNGWPKCKETFDAKCPIAHWTLHDLRRTFATNLAALGVPPHVTERLLNHVTGTISGVAAIYNKFQYMDEMRDAVASWEQRLAALPSASEAQACTHV